MKSVRSIHAKNQTFFIFIEQNYILCVNDEKSIRIIRSFFDCLRNYFDVFRILLQIYLFSKHSITIIKRKLNPLLIMVSIMYELNLDSLRRMITTS